MGKKRESANYNGSLDGRKPMRDALMLELNSIAPPEKPKKGQKDFVPGPRKETYARRIARKLVVAAADGHIDAIKEIHNRVEGKAVQPMANDPENPLIPTKDGVFQVAFVKSKTKA